MLDKWGGRKFLVTMVSGLGTFILVFFDKIDPGTYSVVTIATIGAFIAGNTYQKNVKS